MRATIIGFVLLQIVVWSIVFREDYAAYNSNINQQLADTWEVVDVNNQAQGDVIMHFPTFNKLTLNNDGTFIRFKLDGSLEQGDWSTDTAESQLILDTGLKLEKYDIIQHPSKNSNVFVIKEKRNGGTNGKTAIELARS